jgi:hypothetical protein
MGGARVKGDREKLRREIAAELRRRDREKLAELRDAIRKARRVRREAVGHVVTQCRGARTELRATYRERREALLAELREEYRLAKMRAGVACKKRKGEVRAAGITTEEAARAVLHAERAYQNEIRAAERDAKARARAMNRTAKERASESDDEVRQNIPDDLVPIFNRVKKSIKGTPKLSRTEAFLHWAEENADEVFAMRAEDTEREVARLVAEHGAHEKKMRKAGRYTRSPEELAEELAAVPF